MPGLRRWFGQGVLNDRFWQGAQSQLVQELPGPNILRIDFQSGLQVPTTGFSLALVQQEQSHGVMGPTKIRIAGEGGAILVEGFRPFPLSHKAFCQHLMNPRCITRLAKLLGRASGKAQVRFAKRVEQVRIVGELIEQRLQNLNSFLRFVQRQVVARQVGLRQLSVRSVQTDRKRFLQRANRFLILT